MLKELLMKEWASLMAQMVKNLPAMQETWVQSLGWEDPLEKGMATHSSILAWRIPWTEEPGALQSVGSQRVGHEWATYTNIMNISCYSFCSSMLDRYGLPRGSDGKESDCNAGDLSSIPGLGRSPEEGNNYLLQYSWASPVAQMVKNLTAMQETWLWSLGWEDLLETGKATHSIILAWEFHGVTKSLSLTPSLPL